MYTERGALFVRMNRTRTTGKGYELPQWKFCWNKKAIFFNMKMLNLGKRLSIQFIESPSLKTFKT